MLYGAVLMLRRDAMCKGSFGSFDGVGPRCDTLQQEGKQVIQSNSQESPWPLACPVCNAPLSKIQQSLVCPKRHTFDIARQGYVNLLVSQHRTRGIDGDTAEMLQARRRFLEAGHYQPLFELLCGLTYEALDEAQRKALGVPGCVLEVGCGEGYYIGNMANAASDSLDDTAYMGMDVSRAAAAYAARRYRNTMFFVGDVHRRIYLRDRSVTVLLNMFSPRNGLEFARVLQPGGYVLTVIPDQFHLASLRDRLNLLDIEEDKEDNLLKRLTSRFRIVDRRTLRFPLLLSPDTVTDVVEMGPNFWHRGSSEAGLSPSSPGQIETEAAFVILKLGLH